eukprot:TRINITY_DN177_c0_g1_i20.p2 TRINITY_DN177_c0_g1~~TRINITY_DN177_c0_g1_i20.p2  ORF type:complete len:142 (+),score=23.02 TRINITY_DN177_c0_g1_i20:536-961(+)
MDTSTLSTHPPPPTSTPTPTNNPSPTRVFFSSPAPPFFFFFKQESMVGVYSQNRSEWCITEQACNAYSLTLVPLYETLGADAVKYVVELCDLQVVVCSADKIPNMLEVGSQQGSSITHVISMDPVDKKLVNQGADSNIEVL